MRRSNARRQTLEADGGRTVKSKKSPLITFRIPPKEYESLQEVAKATGQSMSGFVRNAVSSRLREPLDVIEVTAGGAKITVESPAGVVQDGTRGTIPSVSPTKTTGDIQLTD